MKEIFIGQIVAGVAGDGRYLKPGHPKTIVLNLSAEVDKDVKAIDLRDHDEVDFSTSSLIARYGDPFWDNDKYGIPYTDTGVEKSINDYLYKVGRPGDVSWSELDRQSNGIADFDMSGELTLSFLPDLGGDVQDDAGAGASPE